MAQYFIYFQGKQVGPMEKEALLNYGLNRDSYVWEVGTPSWVTASSVQELADILPPAPPFSNGQSNNYNNPNLPIDPEMSSKKLTAALLAIILGSLGIHYFYLGKGVAGIITIVLSMCTCGIWGILMFVQGIVMLTMTDQQFANKYVNTNSTLPLF